MIYWLIDKAKDTEAKVIKGSNPTHSLSSKEEVSSTLLKDFGEDVLVSDKDEEKEDPEGSIIFSGKIQ